MTDCSRCYGRALPLLCATTGARLTCGTAEGIGYLNEEEEEEPDVVDGKRSRAGACVRRLAGERREPPQPLTANDPPTHPCPSLAPLADGKKGSKKQRLADRAGGPQSMNLSSYLRRGEPGAGYV